MKRLALIVVLLASCCFDVLLATESPLGLILPTAYSSHDDEDHPMFVVFYWRFACEGQPSEKNELYISRYSPEGAIITPAHIRTYSIPDLNSKLSFVFGGRSFIYKDTRYLGEILQSDNELYALRKQAFAESDDKYIEAQMLLKAHYYQIKELLITQHQVNPRTGKESFEAATRYVLHLPDSVEKYLIKTSLEYAYGETLSAILVGNKILFIANSRGGAPDRTLGSVVYLIDVKQLDPVNNYIHPEFSIKSDILSYTGPMGAPMLSKLLRYNDDIAILIWGENKWVGERDGNETEQFNQYTIYASAIHIKTKSITTTMIRQYIGYGIDHISAEIIEDNMMICYNEWKEPSEINIEFIRINKSNSDELEYEPLTQRSLHPKDITHD